MIQGKSYSIGQVDGLKYIEIPKGWTRILENGSVQYISPSSSHLKSYENVIEYLKADGTCKCGLDCPFFVHHVFNFDVSVQNKEQQEESSIKESQASTCKLCDKNAAKGKSLVDQMLLQKQPLKQSTKKVTKLSSFDGNFTSKKALSRSRPKLDGPKAKKSRKVSSPLCDIPSPPPIPISSPVQNVPNNISAINQGPLPSFASIVSSSKFFNPGPNRGPLHPTGSLPLKTNNEFTFPKAISNAVTTSTAVTTAQTVTTLVSDKKPSLSETFPSMTVPTTTSLPQSSISKLNNIKSILTVSTPVTTTSSVSLASNVSIPQLSESVCKPAVVPIISTPTLPSAFSPLDGIPSVSADVVKVATKPPAKSKARARPTPRAKPKSKSDNNKTKFGKAISNTTTALRGPPLTAVISSPTVATAATFPVSSQWPVPMASVVSTVCQVPYQIPSTVVTTTTSVPKNVTSSPLVATSYISGNSISRPPLTISLPQQPTLPSSVYMTAATNYQNQGTSQVMQMAPAVGANLQGSQALTTASHASSTAVGNGKESVVLSPTIATPSSSYPVVATPRIQPPPGMMYVATAPGVGMFPASYPYVAATAQQLQASFGQSQIKSSSTTTVASTNPQTTTQGVSTDASQGKVSFQVPGMYVQGTATNQMFPLGAQGFNVNHYKGAYQLQNAMYPGAVPGGAMTFISPNGAKATYPGIQTMAAGNIGQFAAYTNPYMLGIVMTTSTNQPASVSVTSTRSSPATQTSVTTSLQMIQPQSLQNPAIAAAFESFVPIAPAAGGTAPRFAQTLAHLASAYNAFPAGGLVQGPNPNQLHLAYQMMQMNPQTNTPQATSVGGMVASDSSVKHTAASSGKQSQTTSATDATKGSSSAHSKGHCIAQSPTSSSSPTSTVAQDVGNLRSTFASPVLQLPSSPSPPSTSVSSVVSITQAHKSITTKPDYVIHNQKPLSTQLQEKCSEPVSCSNAIGSSSLTGMDNSCNDVQRLLHENNKTNNFSSNIAGQGMRPAVTGLGSVSTDQCNSLAVTHSSSCYTVSPLQNKQNTLPSSSESNTSNTELSCEVQKYHHKLEHDNLTPVRTPNFPVDKLNFPSENTGSSNNHSSKSRTESPPKQINSCAKGGALLADTISHTRTLESRDPVIPTNYVDKVNYYENNPLLGMKRSCEAIEVYPDPPENPNCADDDKEDYYSSNEESLEEHPYSKDDTASEIVLDHRQGENQLVEEPFRISHQVHTAAKDLYNGGCNETCNEPDIQNKFPSIKPTQTFVGESFRPDMFGAFSIPHIRPHFDVGDVVWAQARGLPSWPGKIVDESKVGKGKADDGKKWVMWFGDHTFSQVEVDRLKTLNDGLRTLDDKARKKKYRAKKARISLEQAISEALEELEVRKQLKARQAAMRPKTKKKRLR